MKHLFLFVGIILFFLSCKKEEESVYIDCRNSFSESINNPQGTLTSDCNDPVVLVENNLPEYKRPQFNPNNPNEIIFTYYEVIGGVIVGGCKDFLYKFDLCNGIKTEIISSWMCEQVDWGINNEILFLDQNHLSILDNKSGEETELIFNQLNSNTVSFIKNFRWSQDASGFVTLLQSFNSNNYFFKFYNKDGTPITQLAELALETVPVFDWKNDFIVYSDGWKIFYYNINTEEKFQINSDVVSNNEVRSIHIIDDNRIVWNDDKRIALTKIDSGIRYTINYAGENDSYLSMDLSRDGKTFLIEKEDQIKIDDCTIQTRRYLSLMDEDGLNERRILIPE